MGVTMSKKSKKEYLEKMRIRYAGRSGKKGKTALIDEFCEVTGHDRKYGVKLLTRNRGVEGNGGAKGRPKTYGAGEVTVLKEIWFLAEQPCGKRLSPVLPMWLKSYKKRNGKLGYGVEKKLKEISPAQIDRLLGPTKTQNPNRRIRTPKSNQALKAVTPIRAESWDVHEPGWIEADTVAHCGGSMNGSFIWSLSMTDIFSGWTEIRSVWNRGQHGVCERFEQIEADLPFQIKGVDTDNGGEFLNWHFHSYFKERLESVELTRSRPYHKNDQAHIEQKNYTHVRQLLGYDRLDNEDLVEVINELLVKWSLWNNLYCSTMKQIEKRREGSRQIRKHEKHPKPPCERLIEHRESIGQKSKVKVLRELYKASDPIEMKEEIEKGLRKIYKLVNQIKAKKGEEEATAVGIGNPLRYAPGNSNPNSREKKQKKPKTKRASVSSNWSQPAAA